MRGSIAHPASPDPSSLSEETSTSYYALLSVFDSLFSFCIVAPAVVCYWRSVWELMTLYVYPDNSLMSALVSTVIGIGGHLLFCLSQRPLERWLHPNRSRLVFYLVSRLYTVCFAFVCVNGWRGPWNILDMYTTLDLATVLATTMVGVIALASIRALRNITATPCALTTDYAKGYFEVVTMFRVTMVQKTSLYILDCLFSVLVVGTLVVFVWRGAWVLLDIYLFPENGTWSAWGSLVLGYMSVAIAFLMQPAMKWLCDRLGGTMRLVVADAFLLFAALGTVNVWRGIWNLLNIYFLPDDMDLSCWITHWVSLILLILLGCSNSLLVRGVYIDAEEPAGKCVLFPCYYLRQIFQHERAQRLFFGTGGAANCSLDDVATIKRELEIGDKLAHYVVGGVVNPAMMMGAADMETEKERGQRKLSEQLQKEQLEGVKVVGSNADSNHV